VTGSKKPLDKNQPLARGDVHGGGKRRLLAWFLPPLIKGTLLLILLTGHTSVVWPTTLNKIEPLRKVLLMEVNCPLNSGAVSSVFFLEKVTVNKPSSTKLNIKIFF
tara:strand:- start:214 stop:531 length:318 start_codon:yes stop_codon:yes gene_type:complete